jgi:hypothetical protein
VNSIALVLILLLLLLQACSNDMLDQGNEELPPAFKDERLFITTDNAKILVRTPIKIITKVTPLISGKGRFEFHGWCAAIGRSWILESPYQDTLTTPQSIDIRIPVEAVFESNKEIEQDWIILLPSNEVYYFTARAVMDSVFIEDSARYYPMRSKTALRYSPGGHGYITTAGARDQLTLDLLH